jgi:hypothetical protein
VLLVQGRGDGNLYGTTFSGGSGTSFYDYSGRVGISDARVACPNRLERIRSSQLVIHVDIPANSTDLRRSKSALTGDIN